MPSLQPYVLDETGQHHHGTRTLYFCRCQRGPAPIAITPHQRLRNLIEEIELADQVGLDVFGLGEHHRPDYAASAPVVALAAAAERTKRIRLTSAVTVLSSDDPVRVFQQFATLDLLSSGRAEIMAGRGSFIESFPLFGYDLDDYDELFAEKLDLLLKLRETERVTLVGQRCARRSMTAASIPGHTRTNCRSGSPSAARRNRSCGPAQLGLPLALAIIGGEPARFAPLFELYREAAAARAGMIRQTLATSLNVHGFVGETTAQAADDFYGPQAEVMNRIGRERGWGPTSRAHFDQSRGPRARYSSATRRRWPRRSSLSTDCSGTTASCCRWRSARCRMTS